MTIASEITRINNNIASAYTAVNNKGGTLPDAQNSSNLETAINSIPTGGMPTLITKTITQNGTYNASSDNADGYSSVTVNVSGRGYTEVPSYKIENGVARRRSGALIGNEFSNITRIGDNGLCYAFRDCSGLTGSLDLSSLTSVGGNGLYQAFRGCSGLTSVDLSSLTSIDGYGLYQVFNSCSRLTSVDLSSLTSIGNYGLYEAFTYCSRLTSVDLSSLTSIGGNGLSYSFGRCSGLTDIYFNSLTTTSFGSYKNQFNNMLSVTGTSVTHTLHFPSNLESTISGLTGYPTFGGTSDYVVCAFDLPETS